MSEDDKPTHPKAFGIAGFKLSLEERLGELVEMVGGATRAAKLTNRSREAVYGWRKKGTIALADALPLAEEAGVTLDWVATGYEYRPDLRDSIRGPLDHEPLLEIVQGMSSDGVPVPVDSQAGAIAFQSEWLSQIDVPLPTARLLTVLDGSMEPTFSENDILLVDTSTKSIDADGTYVLHQEGPMLIRRIQNMVDGSILLSCDNPIYADEEISHEQVPLLNVVGRVRGCWRTL